MSESGRGGGRGRGRGRGGRGRGRGGKGKGGNKNDSDRGGGRGRGGTDAGNKEGGRGNRRRNNKKNAPKTPQISEEERKRQEEEKRIAAEAEAERKRIEEEKKAQEEAQEARRKAKEEIQTKVQEASGNLKSVIDSTLTHIENRKALSPEALAAFRKSFTASKKSLKSDLKKCTAFVKKIKSGGVWSMKPADINRDVSTLNLSRYVDEVVTALLEAELKVKDMPVIVALCKAMHLRYNEFLSNLLPKIWSSIRGKNTDAKNRRLYVRLVTEFILNGITVETKPLIRLIAECTGGKDGTYAVTDATIVVAFVKTAGFEIFGVTPSSIEGQLDLIKSETEKVDKNLSDAQTAESKEESITISSDLAKEGATNAAKIQDLLDQRAVPEDVSDVLLTHCEGAYKTLSSTLVTTHIQLQKMELRCEQDRLLSGTLTEAREKGLADARKLKDTLLKSVEVLSDILHLNMPQLKEEEVEETEGAGPGVELWTKGGDEDGNDFGPFDDEETKTFYCDIPDLLTTVPPALLSMSQDEIDKRKAENLAKYGSGFDALADEGDSDEVEVAATSEADLEAAEQEEAKESTETSEENKDNPHYKLMVLLEQELPECCRREQIDEITERFCTNHGSSKNSRKRLSQTLFLVPRTRLDLLPYYSRMAATLSRVWTDISASLLIDLEQQFHGQAKYKKNQNIESRLRTARYIGELTKFRVAPPMISLRCIRRCLDDFTGGNVDVACSLLESCGRFLYRMKHTNPKLTSLMEAMTRLSKAKVSLIASLSYAIAPFVKHLISE